MGMQLLQRVSNDSLAAIILPEPQKLPPRSFIWPLISLNAFFYRSMDGNGVVTGPSLLEAGDSEYVALTRLGIQPKVNLSLISISARSRPGKGLTGFGIDQIALWNECFRSDDCAFPTGASITLSQTKLVEHGTLTDPQNVRSRSRTNREPGSQQLHSKTCLCIDRSRIEARVRIVHSPRGSDQR